MSKSAKEIALELRAQVTKMEQDLQRIKQAEAALTPKPRRGRPPRDAAAR